MSVPASHFTGGVCDGAGRVALRHRLGCALVAFGLAFDVDVHLPVVPRGPAFHQRHPGRQTHPVHVSARVRVIQTAEDKVEAGKKVNAELGILDIGMVGHYGCFRAKPKDCFPSHLKAAQRSGDQPGEIASAGDEVGNIMLSRW